MKIAAVLLSLLYASCTHALDLGPTSQRELLPDPVYPGAVMTGFPAPLSGQLKVQSGTTLQPLCAGSEYAINSQAIVSAPWPLNSASLWSPHEFSVINQGAGRVHGTNTALIAEHNIEIDNTAAFTYAASRYAGGPSNGGVVGHWGVVDVQGTETRAVGAELVTITGDVDYLDPNPQGTLTTDPTQYATQGAFSIGLRISNLVGDKIIPRGIDTVAENPNAGFDTGVNIQAFRSRGIYIHNNMSQARGGARVGVEASPAVPVLLKWQTSDGTPLTLEQNYSGTFGKQYYVFRKDASFNWWAMFHDGTMTFSTDSANGSKLVVFPDGRVRANHAQTPAFQVKQGGRYYLSDDQQTYIDYNGSNVRIVKNGAVVAQW